MEGAPGLGTSLYLHMAERQHGGCVRAKGRLDSGLARQSSSELRSLQWRKCCHPLCTRHCWPHQARWGSASRL